MQLLAACAVLLGASAFSVLASVDLNCNCRVRHRQDWNYALHCTRKRGGKSEIPCNQVRVLDIPRGYHYVPGYALIRLYRTFKPWAAAKKTCEDEGARLALPPDQAAYEGLKQIFPKEKGIWFAYVGITYQHSEGVFVGVDGRHLKDMEFQVWGVNQPDNFNQGMPENCLSLAGKGTYNDVRCDSALPFVCEILPV